MERNGCLVLFLVLWFTVWTYGLVQGSRTVHHQPLAFILGPLGIMLLNELGVAFLILRSLGGRYILTVIPHKFTVRRQVFGIGWTEKYEISGVRDLRFQPAVGVGRGRRPSRIVFDYGKKKVMFGSDVDEAEANHLISVIKQRALISEASAPGRSYTSKRIKFWRQ